MAEKSQFLPNNPVGKDLLKGKSQERVVDAIKKHILSVDAKDSKVNLPRIIGVEGPWGSGKSNALLQLDKSLGDDYFFFTYDAWGNQEDLQRRSLLELLTKTLIDNEKLEKPTKIKILSNALQVEPIEKECTWTDRLFALLSKRSATHNVTIPTIYDSTKYFALMLVVTGILAPLLNAIKVAAMPCWYSIFALIAVLTPAISYYLLMRDKQKNKEKGWTWKEMFQMYQTSGRTDTSTYTISELEPSVSEFREWMKDVSEGIPEMLHLVIVFDNMDRLPREKVRQLWSSIQTFFAGKGYPKVWCIIPFDRTHLANAFSEATNFVDAQKLTNYFIEKTFPVVYRIPEPIITDYKGVFKDLFEEAFGKRKEQETINRCFRIKHPKANMREIISYINKCVSLSHAWGEEIKLTSIALFVLNSEHIFKDDNVSEKAIVDGLYLKDVEGIFYQDDDLDTEISALAYGVEKNEAAQLPMKNLIANALRKKDAARFDEYAKANVHFYEILKDEIEGMEALQLDDAVNHVSVLSFDGLDETNTGYLNDVWTKLAGLYLNITDKETSLRQEVRALMDNCQPTELKIKVGKKFIESFSDKENPHKGAEWYQVYSGLSKYASQKGISVPLPARTLKSGDFAEFIKAAGKDYKQLPINCNNDELNTYCIELVTNGQTILDLLEVLKDDNHYNFNALITESRRLIEAKEATDINIEKILDVLKFLSNEPVKLNVELPFLDSLQYEGRSLPDLRVLRMMKGKELGNLKVEDIAAMASVVYLYVSTADIWNKYLSMSTNTITAFMTYIVNNDLHDGKLVSATDLLSQMVNVQTMAGLDRKAIVKFVNDWGKKSLTAEEKALDFASTFSQENWIDTFEEVENELSRAILGKYYEDCGGKELGAFKTNTSAWASGNYWSKVLKRVAKDNEFWATKPESTVAIAGFMIEGICSGTINESNIDQEMLDGVLSHVEFTKVSTKVYEVLDKFKGSYSINEYKFKKLHHYFEKTIENNVVLLNNVLKPIIHIEAVQDIVLKKRNFYEGLMMKSMGQASELKNELIKLYSSTQNKEFKELIEKLGIIEEEKEK